MSWERIGADWPNFRGKAQKHWANLSDEDLESAAGDREELAARIQKRYGVEKAAAHKEIEDWMKEPGVLDDWNDRKPILDM